MLSVVIIESAVSAFKVIFKLWLFHIKTTYLYKFIYLPSIYFNNVLNDIFILMKPIYLEH